jgi:hypothetical protein
MKSKNSDIDSNPYTPETLQMAYDKSVGTGGRLHEDLFRNWKGKRLRDEIQKDWDARCKERLFDEIEKL